MKGFYKILFVVFCCVWLMLNEGLAQITFQKAYGNGTSPNIYGNSVKQTFDGGYIIAGHVQYGPNHKLCITKTDSLGNFIWTKIYIDSIPIANYFFSILETSDSGYVVCGKVGMTTGSGAIVLMKTDIDGNMLWTKYYSETIGASVEVSLQEANGGGFIIGATVGNGIKFIILKTDVTGNPVWARSYRGVDYYTSTNANLRKTSDGGYILTGSLKYMPNGIYRICVIRTDSSGNLIWEKTYGHNSGDYGRTTQQTADGGYIILGSSSGTTLSGGMNIYFIKTDSLGNEMWKKAYGSLGSDYAAALIQTNDGGYIINGVNGVGYDDNYLIKTDSNGDTLWTKRYNTGTANGSYNNIERTRDNGYVFVNHTWQFGGSNEILLMKTDSNGVASTCNEEASDIEVYNNPFGHTDTLSLYDSVVVVNYSVPTINTIPLTLTTFDFCITTGIEKNVQNNISISPNPAASSITITTTLQHPTTNTLYDITGRIVMQQAMASTSQQFNISSLTNGVYFAEIKDKEGRRMVVKVVKD